MKGTYQGSTVKIAQAFGKNIDVSPKQCNEICYVIKGMKTDKAINFLEDVEKKKQFVPYRRYTKGIGHRKNGMPGAYPIKAAKIIKNIIKSAKSNAEYKELDTEKLKIIHSNAYKTLTLDRVKPKGRARPHRIHLTNIEIVVKEV